MRSGLRSSICSTVNSSLRRIVHLRPQLTHVLHQVVGERIVVVENKDHAGAVLSVTCSGECNAAQAKRSAGQFRARSTARTTAFALLTDSSYSFFRHRIGDDAAARLNVALLSL